MNKKNLIIGILITLVLILCVVIGIMYLKTDNNSLKIKEFLTEDNTLISEYDVVGSGMPSGYVFTKDFKFSYYKGEREVRNNDEVISYRGTYKIKNNKIILNIKEKEIVQNGTIVEDEFEGFVLVNFTKKIESVNETTEYTVKEIKDKYIVVNGNTNLYRLNVDINYIDILKALAIDEYDEYYYLLDDYYSLENMYESIELSKIEEELKLDNKLTIKFTGEIETSYFDESENYILYLAHIYLKGKEINVPMFNNESDKVIYSSNYGARFYVNKIDKIYVIGSYIASQIGSNYIVVLSDKGGVLETFYDVNLEIDGNNIKIIKHYGSLMEGYEMVNEYLIEGYDFTKMKEYKE